jgi:hypothetical protein
VPGSVLWKDDNGGLGSLGGQSNEGWMLVPGNVGYSPSNDFAWNTGPNNYSLLYAVAFSESGMTTVTHYDFHAGTAYVHSYDQDSESMLAVPILPDDFSMVPDLVYGPDHLPWPEFNLL